MEEIEARRVNYVFRLLLKITGIVFILSGIGFLPQRDINAIASLFMADRTFTSLWPSTPLFIYLYKYVCAANIWLGVFFIYFSRDPERYEPLIKISIGALFIVAFLLLVSGAMYGLPLFIYLAKFFFILLLAFFLFAFRPKKT